MKPLAQQVREALVLVAVGEPDLDTKRAVVALSTTLSDAGAERLARLLKFAA